MGTLNTGFTVHKEILNPGTPDCLANELESGVRSHFIVFSVHYRMALGLSHG